MPQVLIADDDPGVLTLVATQLQIAGIESEAVSTGRAALRKLCERTVSKRPYDVIILDIVMPDVNGWQVLKAIKHNPLWQGIKTIVISGYANGPDDLMRIIEFDGVYVEKRAGFVEDVVSIVERVLRD